MENEKQRPSIREYIKAIAAFGILVTIFMAGFTISGNFWSSSNATLQSDFRRSNEALVQARAELEKVKLEYSQFRDAHQDKDAGLVKQTPVSSTKTDDKQLGATPKNPSGRPSSQSERLSLRAGDSTDAFGGDVIVSLIGIKFEGDPLRHKATFSIGSQGSPTTTYQKQDIGAVVKWKNFEIRLLSADTFDAKFLISRVGGTNK